VFAFIQADASACMLAHDIERAVGLTIGESGGHVQRGLFDPAGVAAVVARATGPVPDRAAARLLWALVVFELWARAFIDRPGDRPAGLRPALAARISETVFATGARV
jgi:hypothetical protein